MAILVLPCEWNQPFSRKEINTVMSTRVRCIFPGGTSRVLHVGPTPTVQTFRLIADNHIRTKCTKPQLRYGTPPAYTVVALSGDCRMLLNITDQETVWIEVCQNCRENMKYKADTHAQMMSGGRHAGMNICTLNDLKSVPVGTSPFPAVCAETLSPNGYYYDLVSTRLGLENFEVYTFSCIPNRFFLYQSRINRLTEVPAKLIHLSGDETVPEEFLATEGFLYEIVNSHVLMEHMTFYTFPVLPGRLFVFDSGLNRLLETHANSGLCESLLGSIESKLNDQPSGTHHGLEQHGACMSERYMGDTAALEATVGCLRYNLKFEAFKGFQTKGIMKEITKLRGNSNMVHDTWLSCSRDNKHSPEAVTAEFSFHSRDDRCEDNTNIHDRCTKFSVADIKVYIPHSLCVPLEKPTPEPHCSAPPPCIYTGVNDDPR